MQCDHLVTLHLLCYFQNILSQYDYRKGFVMKIIEINQLTKYYGKHRGIEGVSFSEEEGEIFGIIGPNGAGKTTLFKMIAGLEKPDGGDFKVGETVKLASLRVPPK